MVTSSRTTSPTRRSRSVLAAVSTAFFAAASQESLLVPITSVTRYTLSAIPTSLVDFARIVARNRAHKPGSRFPSAGTGNNRAGAPDMILRRSAIFLAILCSAVLAAPLPAASGPADGPQRLPVVLPQCVAGYFAPGVVTPSDAEFS